MDTYEPVYDMVAAPLKVSTPTPTRRSPPAVFVRARRESAAVGKRLREQCALAEAGSRSWARRSKAALEKRTLSFRLRSGHRRHRRTVLDVVTPHRIVIDGDVVIKSAVSNTYARSALNRHLDLECDEGDVFDDDDDDDSRVYENVEVATTVTVEIVFHRASHGDSWERTFEIELPLSQALQLDAYTRLRVKPIAVITRTRRGCLLAIEE